MQINFPYLFIALFVSLSLFYYFNQKNRIRREERRERLKEKHQEYLNALMDGMKDRSLEDEDKIPKYVHSSGIKK